VLTVNVRDWDARQVFFRYALETAQIDPVHLPYGRLGANAKRADAAALAEVVLVLPGVKEVLCQLSLTRQQAKAFGFGDSCGRSNSCSDRNSA
jgi:hypothetical protein